MTRWPLIVGIMLVAYCLFALHAKADAWLISPNDVERLGTPKSGYMQNLLQNSMAGPVIRVVKPEALMNVRAPVHINVTFGVGPSGAPPDISTLKVTLIGFLFDIDITKRVLEFADTNGLNIPKARVPVGRHHLQVRIADKKNNESITELILSVVE